MVKEALQKELKEKVKEGVKPSHLKKLKRSKSADDIPNSSSTSDPQIIQLQQQVKFHAETAQNYLQSSQTSQAKVSELEEKLKSNPPSQLLQDQLKEKQQQIENLRKQLETNPNPTDLTALDNSLLARHKNLKD
jgi:molecular chaperone GrpE (heat shock protein)